MSPAVLRPRRLLAACAAGAALAAARSSGPRRAGRSGLEPAEPKHALAAQLLADGYAATLAIDPAAAGFDGTIAITGRVAERSSVILCGCTRDQRASPRGAAPRSRSPRRRHGDELLRAARFRPRSARDLDARDRLHRQLRRAQHHGAFKQVVRGVPYVYTQFEALYAAACSPCFDEPDSKARGS